MASSATCECGAEEQTVDHVVLQCPIHFGLTSSAPVSDVSDPTCANGVWPSLRPVSVAQKNKLSLLLSFHVDAFKRVALSKVLRRSFFQPNYYLKLMI